MKKKKKNDKSILGNIALTKKEFWKDYGKFGIVVKEEDINSYKHIDIFVFQNKRIATFYIANIEKIMEI